LRRHLWANLSSQPAQDTPLSSAESSGVISQPASVGPERKEKRKGKK